MPYSRMPTDVYKRQVDDIGCDGIGSGEPTGAVQQPPVDGQTHPVIEGQKVFGRFHG